MDWTHEKEWRVPGDLAFEIGTVAVVGGTSVLQGMGSRAFTSSGSWDQFAVSQAMMHNVDVFVAKSDLERAREAIAESREAGKLIDQDKCAPVLHLPVMSRREFETCVECGTEFRRGRLACRVRQVRSQLTGQLARPDVLARRLAIHVRRPPGAADPSVSCMLHEQFQNLPIGLAHSASLTCIREATYPLSRPLAMERCSRR